MSIGPWQIALILVIVLIIFGAGKLPRVMGDFGKGIKKFKAGMNAAEDDDTPDKPRELNAAASVDAARDKDTVAKS